MKNYIVGAVIIGLCIIVGLAFFGNKSTTVINEGYGASAGPDHYERQNFKEGFVEGGDVVRAYHQGNNAVAQMTATSVCGVTYLELVTATTTDMTLYVPSPAMMEACLVDGGDRESVWIKNLSTTTGADFVITATGSTMLLYASNTSATLTNGQVARLDVISTSSERYPTLASSSLYYFITPF